MMTCQHAPDRSLQHRLTRPDRAKVAPATGRSYKPHNLTKPVAVE
jgi:hypothetical protein